MQQGVVIKVTAFKLEATRGKKKGVEVTYTAHITNGDGAVHVAENDAQFHELEPHPDLVELFKGLSPHYAHLTDREEHDDSTVKDPATVERCAQEYPCGSIQWKGGDTWDGIMFHGHKVLSSGHACPALTRLVKFNQPNSDYPMADELYTLSEAIRSEVVRLLEGKRKPPVDLFHQPAESGNRTEEEGDGGPV